MSWHNEILKEDGWFKASRNNNSIKFETKSPELYCRICGTRTGLHGFSFDKKEKWG